MNISMLSHHIISLYCALELGCFLNKMYYYYYPINLFQTAKCKFVTFHCVYKFVILFSELWSVLYCSPTVQNNA